MSDKKPRTYVAIILDKSGSMAQTKQAAITGFNEQVQQLKEDSKTQEIFCSLVTFNGEVFEHLWNVPAEELVEANPESYVPGGATAMRDAVGYTVQKLISTTDYEDPNNAYLIITISDGDTRDDKHFGIATLKEIISGCQATKRWTFNYMGCDETYLKEIARQTGTPISNMAAWSNASDGLVDNAFKSARSRQKKYFNARNKGAVLCDNYASDESICADYSAPVEDLDLAEESFEIQEAVKVDLAAVLQKMPKYEDQVPVTLDGERVFAVSNKVKWTV